MIQPFLKIYFIFRGFNYNGVIQQVSYTPCGERTFLSKKDYKTATIDFFEPTSIDEPTYPELQPTSTPPNLSIVVYLMTTNLLWPQFYHLKGILY